MRYNSDTWSVKLPEGWDTETTAECVLLFNADQELGVFQISSFFKDDETDSVTDEDLQEFSELTKDALHAVSFASLKGFYAEAKDEGFMTMFWYLASGSELIFVAYTVEEDKADIEADARDVILNSLRSQY